MKRHWDIGAEATLLQQYLDSLPLAQAAREEQRLRCTCKTLHSLWGEQSCLEHTRTSAWIPSWALAVSSPVDRISQIQSLGKWWSWLFDRQILDDNVLACFSPYSQILREPSTIVLSHKPPTEYLGVPGPAWFSEAQHAADGSKSTPEL